MKVHVVSKPGCGRCMLLKQKLDVMGVEYQEVDASVLTEEQKKDANFPLVVIDDNVYEYAAAIRRLKEEQTKERHSGS